MLDIVYGQTRNRAVADHLCGLLSELNLNGIVYIGYPIIASEDHSVSIDALLVSREYGLVAFTFSEVSPSRNDKESWIKLSDEQDQVYFSVKNNLSRYAELRNGRELGVVINTLTLFPGEPSRPEGFNGGFITISTVPDVIRSFNSLPDEYDRPLRSALQRVTTIKPPKKRTSVTRNNSRGGILKIIEKEIANLDRWQNQAAIETPDGPQRVRGLAGSGKTVVLALKAAYLHAQHPEWDIAVTFYSRSLYQQFMDLIRRFSYWHKEDEPDWKKLRVFHAWGSSYEPGLYSELALSCNATIRDYKTAATMWGRNSAFEGACSELLNIAVAGDCNNWGQTTINQNN